MRKLIFPSKFTAAECVEATHRLNRFPTPLAQQILDELNGRMERGEIKTTALAYLGGLISRAGAGTFVTNVERKSERGRQRVPRTRQGPDRIAGEPPPEPPRVYPEVASNPLCQRVAEIRTRVELRRAAESVANLESESAAKDCLTEGEVTTRNDIGSTRKQMEIPSPERLAEI